MNAKLVSKFGFACPECGDIEVFKHELQTVEAYRINENTWGDGTYIPVEALEYPVDIYLYHDHGRSNCAGEDEPEYSNVYQCSKCENFYLDETEAEECCNE